MRGGLALAVAVGVAGCAAQKMSAVDLAGRAQGNMLEAQQQLAGHEVILSGVVQSTTLVPRGQITLTAASYNTPVTATTTQDQVPLVILQPGSVFCYFEPFAIEDAAHLKQGDQVSLRCLVDSFRAASPPMSVLASCRRDDRWY